MDHFMTSIKRGSWFEAPSEVTVSLCLGRCRGLSRFLCGVSVEDLSTTEMVK